MKAALLGRAGVEMTADPAFNNRVRRLTAVSVFALGAVWALTVGTLDTHPGIEFALLAGWILMPVLLGLSLRSPGIRFFVALPATLVSGGLIGICLTALPADGTARAGWLSTTAGILLGGTLGAWFWYRWLPVPRMLDDPFSPGRWALIALHVSGAVAGLLLVLFAQLE